MAFSSPSDINSTVNMFEWVNSTVNNMFFPLSLVAVFIIILIKMLSNRENTISKSFASASFSVMVLCIFARILDFVSTGFMSLFIIFTAAGAIWMHMENTG